MAKPEILQFLKPQLESLFKITSTGLPKTQQLFNEVSPAAQSLLTHEFDDRRRIADAEKLRKIFDHGNKGKNNPRNRFIIDDIKEEIRHYRGKGSDIASIRRRKILRFFGLGKKTNS